MIDTRIFGIELDSAAIYEMVLTLQKYHGQQNRHAGLAPYWHHCVRVGSYLGQALQISHQGKDLNWNTQLIQAALVTCSLKTIP